MFGAIYQKKGVPTSVGTPPRKDYAARRPGRIGRYFFATPFSQIVSVDESSVVIAPSSRSLIFAAGVKLARALVLRVEDEEGDGQVEAGLRRRGREIRLDRVHRLGRDHRHHPAEPTGRANAYFTATVFLGPSIVPMSFMPRRTFFAAAEPPALRAAKSASRSATVDRAV